MSFDEFGPTRITGTGATGTDKPVLIEIPDKFISYLKTRVDIFVLAIKHVWNTDGVDVKINRVLQINTRSCEESNLFREYISILNSASHLNYDEHITDFMPEWIDDFRGDIYPTSESVNIFISRLSRSILEQLTINITRDIRKILLPIIQLNGCEYVEYGESATTDPHALIVKSCLTYTLAKKIMADFNQKWQSLGIDS